MSGTDIKSLDELLRDSTPQRSKRSSRLSFDQEPYVLFSLQDLATNELLAMTSKTPITEVQLNIPWFPDQPFELPYDLDSAYRKEEEYVHQVLDEQVTPSVKALKSQYVDAEFLFCYWQNRRVGGYMLRDILQDRFDHLRMRVLHVQQEDSKSDYNWVLANVP